MDGRALQGELYVYSIELAQLWLLSDIEQFL